MLALLVVVLVHLLGGGSGGAQEKTHHAGLVIRDQAGELTYAYVGFAEPEISGLELLERSGVPVVTVGFGGLGEAVCAIGEQGCGIDECRRRLCQGPGPDDPFWQSFVQTTPGAWRPHILGASAATVRDGEIHGWSWTSGEPGLPAVTLDEVAAFAQARPNEAGATEGAGSPVEWPAIAGAGAILVVIGGGALLLSRRRPRANQTP